MMIMRFPARTDLNAKMRNHRGSSGLTEAIGGDTPHHLEVVKLLLRYFGIFMFYSVFLSVASHYHKLKNKKLLS